MNRLARKMAAVALATLGPACSVVGARTAKEPPYRVTLMAGSVEIREYAPYLVARTRVSGEYDDSGREGFRRLLRYISGNNTEAREISMTAPVIQEKSGVEIAMTAPVPQERVDGDWQMDFVLPTEMTLETAPTPRDSQVVIERVPGQTVAVISYSSTVSDDDIREKSEKLLLWIDSSAYHAESSPRSARYDPPFTLPFLRRNEVHITVAQRSAAESL